MMNMLVAILTNSFEENQEVQELLILRTKLRFIIESFDIFDPFEKDEQDKLAYIVVANLAEEDEEEIELVKEVQDSIEKFRDDESKNQQKVLMKLKTL